MKPFKTLLIPLLLTTSSVYAEEITIATPVFPQPEYEKQIEFVEPKGLPEAAAYHGEQALTDTKSKSKVEDKPMPIVLDKSGKQVDVTNLNKGQKQ